MDNDTLGLFIYLDQLEKEKEKESSAWDLQALDQENEDKDNEQNQICFPCSFAISSIRELNGLTQSFIPTCSEACL